MGGLSRATLLLASLAVSLALLDCRRSTPRTNAADPGLARPDAGAHASARCLPVAESLGSPWSLPEASAAAEVELTPGVREMLAVSDSGHDGAAMAWRIPAGPLRALVLPLDSAASDDVEAISWRAGSLYALTSSGGVRRFVPDGHGGLARAGPSYPIGPTPFVCKDLDDGNCGKDYEGLCLRAPSPPDAAKPRCVGYAASRREGALYCLVFQGDRLSLDPVKRPLMLALPKKSLSDCAFGAAGGPAERTLLVTTNVRGGSTSYVIDEATGALAELDVPSTVSNEAIAADRDGSLYLFQDDDGDTSVALRATCTGW